jgi:hypothetical protein
MKAREEVPQIQVDCVPPSPLYRLLELDGIAPVPVGSEPDLLVPSVLDELRTELLPEKVERLPQ